MKRHLYIQRQADVVIPYLRDAKTVLDFGCGDLSLTRELTHTLPAVKLTGVDVVDSKVRIPRVTFRLYDGTRLPFGANTFDTTIAYHVFHHCRDPKAALKDVMRVTKKQILMVEPCLPAGRRSGLDLFLMKILDRIGNGWRNVAIPMPFTFQKEETWRRWAGEKKWTVYTVLPAGVLPAWLPFGVTKLFVLRARGATMTTPTKQGKETFVAG